MPKSQYSPDKYVNPEKVNQVLNEYKTRTRSVVSKDENISQLREQNEQLRQKIELTNKLAIENSELQHELHFARQLLVGKDKTIAHLKAKHPHQ